MSEEKLEKPNIKAGLLAIWKFSRPFKKQLKIDLCYYEKMIGLILAAGFGASCRSLTNDKPKSLLPKISEYLTKFYIVANIISSNLHKEKHRD